MEFFAKLSVINLYQCEKGFYTLKRIFDYPYLLYVHNGKGEYKIGNTIHHAKSGDIFFCPIGVENSIYADSENPFLLSGIEITTNDNDYLEKNLNEKNNIIPNPFLHSIIKEIINQYFLSTIFSDKICNNLLTSLLYKLFNLSSFDSYDIRQDIIDYIQENFNKNLNHRTLSNLFNFHKNTINNILIKSCGLTLKNYQIELRLKRASELLSYSNKPVLEIAEICGYSSASFFSKQFKEKLNLSPLQWRNKNNIINTKSKK